MSTGTGWAVGVLDRHEVYLCGPKPDRCARHPVREAAWLDPVHTLESAARIFHGNPYGSATLILAGRPELVEHWRAAATREGIAAWKLAGGWSARAVEPWTTWRREGAPVVHVGVLGRVPLVPPLGREETDSGFLGDIARRVARYAEAVGAPYLMTPGVSGHAAIRSMFSAHGRRAQPYWGARDTRDVDDPRTGAGDLIWRRPPLRDEVEAGMWVHGWDLNAARLAAMGVAEVAYGRLAHRGPQAFDASEAGYWRIHARDVRQHPRRPPLFDPADVREGMVHLTTPIMAELLRRGISPDVTDSWTAPGRRLFRRVAELWDAARRGDDPVVATAAKETYRQAAGLFAHAGGSIYRPDWYHTIMDRQRVTVLAHTERIAHAHSVQPVAVHTDCLWYVCPEADQRRAADRLGLRLGSGLGMWRHHSSAPAREFFKAKG